ncbi:tripartite-type tricarboxylate transporter receptor subunit TctC [Bacillus thermophilus]|uniref:Tripartite-type tricarboxylate transporter receptor subunit TctC n=1 Tax=Siminovitchia thermophila TaxID=1245522 RepID=A0ABS2R7N8_9BACI|nr:tripartite tricarboxylate transporter substrate binding protein [Siminovitchia thermophila]MBM7715672.1 tripartite-type tricarboxylate transporter receptor subunit TctC [Siminovitchia thermophila]
MKKKWVTAVSFICAALLLMSCSASGGNGKGQFPEKSITYSIPFEPGGQSDIEARRQQSFLEKYLKQKIVIQYKPGGGGSVGWSELVNQKADGYFLAGINIPHIILQPLANEDTGYQTEDIVPIAIFQTTPIALTIGKDSGIDSLDDFIQKAKENPGSITVAGSGNYSGHHIAFLQLQDVAGIELQYVPFDGAGPSMQAFLGGNTDAVLANSSDLLKYTEDMKILAIGSEETFEPMPEVPTFIEEGYDITASIDRGVGAPPDTDLKIIHKLEKAFLNILEEPGVKDQMYEEGFEPKAMGHEESVQYIEQKTKEFADILEKQ